MAIYINGKLVAGIGGGTSGGGIDIPASDTAPTEGNYWLDTSEDGDEYTRVESFNGRTGTVVPQSGDYTAEMTGALGTEHNTDSEAHADIREAIENAFKCEYVTVTMLASGWVDNVYSFEDTYPNDEYDVSIEVASTATVEQFDAFCEARICGSVGSNTATAINGAPAVDIPIIIKAVKK